MKLIKNEPSIPGVDKFIVTFVFTDGSKETIREVSSYGIVQQYPTLFFCNTLAGDTNYYVLNNLRKYSAKKSQ